MEKYKYLAVYTQSMQIMAKNIIMIAALLALLALPVAAGTPNQEGICTHPPDAYFVTDGPMNGQPVHDGIQLGFRFWIPATEQYTPGGYLGIKEYKLQQSHADQEKIALGRYWYCNSIPDVPYVEPVQGAVTPFTSENPAKSVYAEQHGTRFI
jgi:hypothetical protein